MAARPGPFRAAVTGIGAVCALGRNGRETRAGLRLGERHTAPAARISPDAMDFPFFAAPDDLFEGGRAFTSRESRVLCLQAAAEAVEEAGLAGADGARTAVVAGTTSGSALHFLSGYEAFRQGRAAAGDLPQACRDYLRANPAMAIAEHFGLGACAVTLSNACVSGADAIGLALDMLLSDRCERVLCGGVDTLSLVPHTGFARLLIYDSQPCRPFDKSRAGLNLGEGAAFLLLESEESARRRGQRVLGRVLGYGSRGDAHHFTRPHPEGRGLEAAICDALSQAGTAAADIAFVNVHGTGTLENDRVEGSTLARVLPDTPLWCTKGLTGHTLGAAGALEAAFTLWALEDRLVPASIGFHEADPETMAFPLTEPRPIDGSIAMSTSLGFGGCNSALVLGAGDMR